MNARLLATWLVAAMSTLAQTKADDVVASNLPATQLSTNAFEEVGLIAPAWNHYINVSKGQQFIPSVNGTLATVEALVVLGRNQPTPTSPPLNVSIYTANDGIPVTKLATRSFPATDFLQFGVEVDVRKFIDFSQSQTLLVAGNRYLVAFETPYGVIGDSGADSPYLIGWPQSRSLGLSASQARDGIHWERFNDTRELAIAVSAVPEPATGILLLSAIATCTYRRRQRTNRRAV